jgi:hypothetical protein
MSNVLHSLDRDASCVLRKHRRKGLPRRSALRAKAGWTPERRARQAALIRRWAPWRRSTGPKTEAGKARCAANPIRHGFYSAARVRELQRVRYALRLAAANLKVLRLLIQLKKSAARLIAPSPGLRSGGRRHPWHRLGSRAILNAKYAKYGGETCAHSNT